jgi:hypothetical protein
MMSRKQYALLVVFVLIGGLVGGVLSNKIFIVKQAFAQKMFQSEKSIIAQIVTAKAFHLVDENGNTRGLLTTDSSLGGTYLELNDNSGRLRLRLSVAKEGASFVHLLDEDGRPLVGLSLSGKPTLFISQPLEDVKFLKDINIKFQKPNPLIIPLVELTTGENGEPKLEMWDKKGMVRAVLGSIAEDKKLYWRREARPVSSLVFFGEDTKKIWSAP